MYKLLWIQQLCVVSSLLPNDDIKSCSVFCFVSTNLNRIFGDIFAARYYVIYYWCLVSDFKVIICMFLEPKFIRNSLHYSAGALEQLVRAIWVCLWTFAKWSLFRRAQTNIGAQGWGMRNHFCWKSNPPSSNFRLCALPATQFTRRNGTFHV